MRKNGSLMAPAGTSTFGPHCGHAGASGHRAHTDQGTDVGYQPLSLEPVLQRKNQMSIFSFIAR